MTTGVTSEVSCSFRAAVVWLALGGLLLSTSAAAQPAMEVAIGRSFDSSSGSAVSGDGGTLAGGVQAEYWLAGERVRLFYDLDAGDYATPGDWRYLLHEGGGSFRVDPAQGRARLYFGGTAVWRDNGASWAAAGYRALGAFANFETGPTSGVTWRAGYRFDVRRFPDFTELDQQEHGLFTSVLVNLQTRTTLIGEVRIGRKSYASVASPLPVAADGSVAPVATGGRGAGGRGSGGPGLRTQAVVFTSAPDQAAGLVTWMGRLAQSLADRTGVAVQYSERRTFGTLPPVMVVTPALFFDDGVYDDPYASNQRAAGVSIKQVFGSLGTLEGWGAWSAKHYTATPAYGLDGLPLPGAPLRTDRIWRGGAGWSVPLAPTHTGPIALDLVVHYTYTHHQSNDLLYNYRSHVIGVGTTLGF
jgi:hypothetical protein